MMLSRDNARKETRADKQAVEAASIVLAEEVSRLEQADMPDAAGRILVAVGFTVSPFVLRPSSSGSTSA
jgi:hypothetical protein